MEPRIKMLAEKKLIGKSLVMSLADNKTVDLWRSFMPRRKEIQHTIGNELFSLQVYDDLYFKSFDPHHCFEKWAAVEVSSFDLIPEGMQSFTLTSGLYAVFLHKGSSTDKSIFQYIFTTWLPASAYELDHRPHFELLGENYRNNDPGSEEEIWIPIKERI